MQPVHRRLETPRVGDNGKKGNGSLPGRESKTHPEWSEGSCKVATSQRLLELWESETRLTGWGPLAPFTPRCTRRPWIDSTMTTEKFSQGVQDPCP